jgi:cell division septum initiation protein DivIVA
MANPRQDEKPANPAGQDAARKATEEATRTARTIADVGEHAARVSADTLQRNAETAKQVWQSASDMATKLTERSADQLAPRIRPVRRRGAAGRATVVAQFRRHHAVERGSFSGRAKHLARVV